MSGKCAVCLADAIQQCAGCKTVYYCGREHQKSHWAGHKQECRPVQVEEHPVLGRHLVATRDIAQGELIIRELPLITGPKIASVPICLGCNEEADLNCPCPGCGWPLCNLGCSVAPSHQSECELMKSKGFVASIKENNRQLPDYAFVTPLRALLLPQNKLKTLKGLQSHLEVRRTTPLYNLLKFNVAGFIQNRLGLELADDEILEACAILDTNAFEMRRGRSRFRGLFPLVSMMAHDCVPNTRHAFDQKDAILLFATTDIKKGDTLTATYTQPFWSTSARRAHLRSAKCFDCSCQRCTDPEELGTLLSAIKCNECPSGHIKSSAPLEDMADWVCTDCGQEVAAEELLYLNQSITKEIESLDKTGPEQLEWFLGKYEEILHPRNGHVLQVKMALAQIYGNAKGYTLQDLTREQIARKIELTEDLLEVLAILEPGKSRTRAQMQLELTPTLVFQAKLDLEATAISKDAAEKILQDSVKQLTEASEVLKTDHEFSTKANEKLTFVTSLYSLIKA